MTTGRINQVTILSAGARGPRRHPARAGQSSSLTGGARPPTGGSLERAAQGPAGHPIAPTEFPKGPSTAPRSSAGALPQGVIWAPQGEGTFRRTSPRGAVACMGLPPSV